jgi:predicted component of type VI protein secretion system
MFTKLLLKVLEASYIPKDNRTKIVDKHIFRIGREPDNDWIITCPNRLISRHHCIIEYINNTFTINDLSKNGVFINNSPSPIGLGNSGILSDGDILILPGVKISVSFADTKESTVNDPFLALLPSRENGPVKQDKPKDPIIASVQHQTSTKTSSYSFLDDRSILPPTAPDISSQRQFSNYAPKQQHSELNLDRLPAAQDSIRLALPQTMPIPEDWDIEEEKIIPQNIVASPQKRNSINQPKDTHRQLLLALISEFSKIDKAISNSNDSHLLTLLAEHKLNRLSQSDLELAVKLIEEITIESISIVTKNHINTLDAFFSSNNTQVDETSAESRFRTSEASDQKRALNVPLTGGDINELE